MRGASATISDGRNVSKVSFGPRTHRRIVWIAVAVVLTAAVALGVRQIANANTFQLFGDYVARVVTTEPVVALTFDDGPHPVYTPVVLDLLDKYHATATFFMMGLNVERFPAVVQEVRRRGHEIGNHSYSHDRLVLVSAARVRDEIERTDRLLREAGVTGEILFRAPHLSKLIAVPYVLRQMKKLSVLADVDAEEWRRRPPEVMTASVLGAVRPGSIVMMHDPNGRDTIAMLEVVLPALVERGYRFETVSQLVRRR
jgi:peptidoglycan-N-acetylglucosamine deacetylase